MANKVCIDNIWYELNKETKEATVTYPDNEEEKYQGEVVISEIVVYEDEEYDVMKIESFAFEPFFNKAIAYLSSNLITVPQIN